MNEKQLAIILCMVAMVMLALLVLPNLSQQWEQQDSGINFMSKDSYPSYNFFVGETDDGCELWNCSLTDEKNAVCKCIKR